MFKNTLAIIISLSLTTEVLGETTTESSADRQLWSPVQEKLQYTNSSQQKVNFAASDSKNYRLDVLQLQQLVQQDHLVISVPLPNGESVSFALASNQLLSPQLAEKYPDIKTFSGVEVGNPDNKGRFDFTTHGFRAMFNQGEKMVLIDPKYRGDQTFYSSYYRDKAKPLTDTFRQLSPRKTHNFARYTQLKKKPQKRPANELITYRIAVAATAEYTAFHGGTKQSGLAAIVTMLNRLNQVYAQDMNIQLQLVGNNDAIIFTNSETDPFDNTDADLDKVGEAINQAIGFDNYDIGHVVGTGGGGIAGFGVVCTEFKADGLTGSPQPTNDAFYIDFVAHEIGHQFMADHTFNGTSGGCDGNRADDSAYEPGSASSIMGYAGICDEQNIQNRSDPYFHVHSIQQMSTFISSGAGQNCGVRTPVSNSAPVVNAGADYTIPARTPFTLTGSATDASSDNLIYSWEQYDLGAATSSPEQDATDSGTGPLFRVWAPTPEPTRTLPRMQDLLSNTTAKGEALPTQNREINFRLLVRDQKGGVADDAMKITVVANSAGFAVTEPSAGTRWNGNNQTVQWNTADTQQAPVSCSRVDIALSVDSGASFEHSLGQYDNNGSAQVSLPTLNTDKARLKVSCSNNIFFNVNSGDFQVNSNGSEPAPTKPSITGQKTLSVNEDGNLTLSTSDFNYQSTQGADSIRLQAVGNSYQLQGLTISPNANFNGSVTVTVIAKRGELESDPFTASITVNAVNDAPVSVDDSITVQQDSAAQSINVLANDTDVDGDSLNISRTSYTGGGQVSVNGSSISYTPAAGFSGNESFSYEISDGNGGTATANVRVTVNATPPSPQSNNSSGGGSLSFGLLLLLLLCSRRYKHS